MMERRSQDENYNHTQRNYTLNIRNSVATRRNKYVSAYRNKARET